MQCVGCVMNYFSCTGREGIAILMVPENSDLMRHYEEAAARGELEEEYDGLEITLEEARNAGVSFRPTGADDSFKEEYATTRFRRCFYATFRETRVHR